MTRAERYADRKARRVCVDCQAGLADDDARLRCLECRERQQRSDIAFRARTRGKRRVISDVSRATMNARRRRQRQERKEAGVCAAGCGRQALEDNCLCATHRARLNVACREYQRRRRERGREMSAPVCCSRTAEGVTT